MTRLITWSLALTVACSGVAHGQTFRGGISGRVLDSTGAMLPGVSLTVTNTATGTARTTTSSGSGDFSFPDLPLGTYTIEASLQGFQTIKTAVEVINRLFAG